MKFFRRWNGLKLAEAAEKKVDTVTRATYSSRAVIAGVRNAARTALAPKPAAQSNPAAMRLPQFDGQLKKLFPDYAELLPCGGPDCRILAADGTELGMLLLENGDTERTTAFADTIELALALRADGTVAGILIGANQETPGLSGFRPRRPVLQQLERPDAEAGAVPRSRCGDRRDLQQPRDPGRSPPDRRTIPDPGGEPMMFLPLLIGAAVAPAPARPETDAGKLAAAPAAAHRPYDFREEEEQNEFRRMKELLENDTPESAAELRAILTRQLEREIAFTAARRTYFEAKCRRPNIP